MRDRKRCKLLEFTLIELLVVISIIVILVSMLLPALEKARQMAYQSKCLSNLKQLAFGVTGYTDDFKSQLPYGNGSSCYMFNAFGYGGVGSYIALPRNYSYYPTEGGIAPYRFMAWNICQCPAGGYDGLTNPSYTPAATTYPNYGYGLNAWFSYWPLASPNNYTITLARVKKPSQRMLLGDSGADLWRTFYTGTNVGNYLGIPLTQTAFRHNKLSGYAFADGHSEMRKLADVPTQRPDGGPTTLTEFWRSE